MKCTASKIIVMVCVFTLELTLYTLALIRSYPCVRQLHMDPGLLAAP